MSEATSSSAARAAAKKPANVREAVADLSRSKKLMLAAAGAFVLIGLLLAAFGGSTEPAGETGAGVTGGAGGGARSANLVGGAGGGAPQVAGAGDDVQPEAEGASTWAPFFVKGGFSFALAFCIGYALRMFFKLTAFVVGVYALGLFGLTYVGWVDVDWNAISLWWDGMLAHVQGQAASIKTFITGSLPSAGLATAGLVTGFRKG
jgi:uncharacterized membrane protein (Fun14 family)